MTLIRKSLHVRKWHVEMAHQQAAYLGLPVAGVYREALSRGLELLKIDIEADCRNGEVTESLLPEGWRDSLFAGIRSYNPDGVGTLVPMLTARAELEAKDSGE